jgi:hypothetical protein
LIAQLQDLMDVKGQQIEHKKGVRQKSLTMTEVVFDMVPLILQGVEGFVFDFPARPAGFDQLDDIGLY